MSSHSDDMPLINYEKNDYIARFHTVASRCVERIDAMGAIIDIYERSEILYTICVLIDDSENMLMGYGRLEWEGEDEPTFRNINALLNTLRDITRWSVSMWNTNSDIKYGLKNARKYAVCAINGKF